MKTTKRLLVIALSVAMLMAFMPVTQGSAYAAAAKTPAKVTGVKVTVSKDNKVTITWKAAKNAKTYNVSIKDGSSGLTAVKSSKKVKVTFKGGNAVKYTVKVQGVNGKKKGQYSKAVSKKTNDLLKAARAEAAKAKKDLEAAKAAKEAAEKQLADLQAAVAVSDAWREVPAIDEDSSDTDIAAAKAVISAYDELTDDQKALVSDSIKTEIAAAKTVIETIDAAAAKIAAVKQAIKDAESGSTVTIDEKEFIVVSKESGKAELVLKNGIENVPFDAEGGYDWASSSLRTYLNSSEGWLAGNPTVSALAEETLYSYAIGEYDMNDEDYVYNSKTSTDHVYIPAFDTATSEAKLPETIVTQLKVGCAFWTSCGHHVSFYDEGELFVMQGAVSVGEGNNWEEDTSATQTTYDGGATYVPIKVNPMFTVSLN